MSELEKRKDRRKASKPIMEKRRRARINESLNELKALILEAVRKDNSCYSKLEKADVLEMTVQHLKNLRNQENSANSPSSSASHANYRAGFNQCATEITQVMDRENTDMSLRTRLLEHLAARCLVNKPGDAADSRGQPPQFVFPSQTLLAKTSMPSTPSPGFTFIPQASPRLLSTAQYQAPASNLLTNAKVAVLLPAMNPFVLGSSSHSIQPSLIPVLCKDPQQIGLSAEGFPREMGTRALFGNTIPGNER